MKVQRSNDSVEKFHQGNQTFPLVNNVNKPGGLEVKPGGFIKKISNQIVINKEMNESLETQSNDDNNKEIKCEKEMFNYSPMGLFSKLNDLGSWRIWCDPYSTPICNLIIQKMDPEWDQINLQYEGNEIDFDDLSKTLSQLGLDISYKYDYDVEYNMYDYRESNRIKIKINFYGPQNPFRKTMGEIEIDEKGDNKENKIKFVENKKEEKAKRKNKNDRKDKKSKSKKIINKKENKNKTKPVDKKKKIYKKHKKERLEKEKIVVKRKCKNDSEEDDDDSDEMENENCENVEIVDDKKSQALDESQGSESSRSTASSKVNSIEYKNLDKNIKYDELMNEKEIDKKQSDKMKVVGEKHLQNKIIEEQHKKDEDEESLNYNEKFNHNDDKIKLMSGSTIDKNNQFNQNKIENMINKCDSKSLNNFNKQLNFIKNFQKNTHLNNKKMKEKLNNNVLNELKNEILTLQSDKEDEKTLPKVKIKTLQVDKKEFNGRR